MQARLRELGERIAALRADRGLSALALSKAAGLSMNYVRNVERGLRRPRPEPLMALASALHLDDRTAAELRRLAGIDPDPAATPEAKAARRAAWPVLLYGLANHILLPRLELAPALARPGPRAESLRTALDASDALRLHSDLAATRPPAPIIRLIEQHFGQIDPGLLKDRASWVDWAAGTNLPVEQPQWYYRGMFDPALLLHLRRGITSKMDALDFVESYGFDRNFALRVFPCIYWEACRFWPFEKILLPLGRLAPDGQRQLYDRIRSGLSLEDLDCALLGGGRLGAALRAHKPRRPTIDAQNPGFTAHSEQVALFDLDAPDVQGSPPDYCGPIPRVDAILDHLDRSEFLDRFPLLKMDLTSARQLAMTQELRSWQTWVEDVRAHARRLSPDMPPLGDEPCRNAIPAKERARHRQLGFAGARIADAYRAAAEQLVLDADWAALLEAARALPIDQRVVDLVRPFAQRADDTGAPDPDHP